ncbi:MAG: 1-(5-phosphoribosyl)-5-[(5-phosphoribosylamino)methylideneamino] imidazole-4-carboxamide isomerase [Steroidobacteraceae bacterium]
MMLIPSIDLRGGRCVRLLKGDFAAETHYERDPVQLLQHYADLGARWLHVVDLDGAKDGQLGNRALILQLVAQKRMQLQVGGGLRSTPVLDSLLRDGVGRAVIGSAAAEQRDEVKTWLRDYGADAICIAVDIRFDASGVPRLRTRGWVQETAVSLWELLEDFSGAGLRHVLCTDIDRDGALAGPNLELYAEAQRRFPQLAWQASGGVRDALDLAALADLGLAAAISGKALLEGRFTPQELQPFWPAA